MRSARRGRHARREGRQRRGEYAARIRTIPTPDAVRATKGARTTGPRPGRRPAKLTDDAARAAGAADGPRCPRLRRGRLQRTRDGAAPSRACLSCRSSRRRPRRRRRPITYDENGDRRDVAGAAAPNPDADVRVSSVYARGQGARSALTDASARRRRASRTRASSGTPSAVTWSAPSSRSAICTSKATASPRVCVTLKDTFAPAAPVGLRGVAV